MDQTSSWGSESEFSVETLIEDTNKANSDQIFTENSRGDFVAVSESVERLERSGLSVSNSAQFGDQRTLVNTKIWFYYSELM